MTNKYPLLLKPGKMGPWELPNRIIMAPMGTLNADKNGYITDRSIAFYAGQAEGGYSLIFVECTYTDQLLSKGEENCQGIYENGQITGYRRLATAIKDKGVKAVLQLCHIGHQISLADHTESLGPSTMVEMMGGVYPFPIRGATREEITQIIEDFANCAWRAKMAGFDGVQIHGAIGHLINMFCTPFYNRRTDEYGGTPENRIRFMIEIIEAVQKKCGKDYPVIARVCGCDFDPDGITMEEGIIHAKLLEKTGVAALHVVGGSNRNVRTINIQYDPRGDFLPIGKAFKDAGIKTPIIIDGGLSTPDIAEKVIADGVADFVGLGRPALADPAWVKKLEEGRPEDIVPCIRCCMGCVGTIEQFTAAVGVRCSVNPRCNLHGIRDVAPVERSKKVCVVGAGPGGMEAAKLLAQRGHAVTLYEKRKLGGVMHEAAFDLKIKEDIQILIDYYVGQMEKQDIEIVYEEATAEKILDGGYDTVIVATGTIPLAAHVPGADQKKVYSLVEYAGNRGLELGENVLVVGGCFPNVEIAYKLAKEGKKVVLSTRRGKKGFMMELGEDNSSPMQQRLLNLIMQYGVDIRFGKNITKITEQGAVLSDVDEGDAYEIPCDNILLCRGYRGGGRDIYKELQGKVKELYRVGDCTIKSRCIEYRTIGDAIHEGWVAANNI
jgi:2,4-dienoyl-CoA reductase-like NADH-dependent reductase (Old Yellow Enzyme family)/thioredoxin reductase